MISLRWIATLALILLCSCERTQHLQLDNYRLFDLTHTFDENTLFWPTDKPFQHERVAWGVTEGGYWYSSYRYAASEHGGTHLDAPIHFAEGKRGVAAIPMEQLVGPAAVIDVVESCNRDADYLLAVADLDRYEQQHGSLPAGTIVLVRTGWSRFWPDAKQYLGSHIPGDVENLHFPGVSEEAARALVERGVAAVGIDTASIDRGMSRDFRAHQVFAAADIPCLENVARLEDVPPTGAMVFALPMKIGNGSGAPCRIVALVSK